MLVRMKCSIMGDYFGIPANPMYAVERGQVIDLDPEHALHEVRNDRVELTLDGPIGKGPGANVKDLAFLQKEVAAIVARRTAASPICDCGCGQALPDSKPHGVVSKLRRIAG